MDGKRFDRLTRGFALSTGRRTFLKVLASGMVSVLPVHRGAAAPKLKPVGARCHTSAQCASGFCDSATRQCIALCMQGGDCQSEPCAPGCHCYCDPFVSNPDGSVRRICLQDPPDPPACSGLVVCLDSHDECPRGTMCTASSSCGADAVCLPLCEPSAG
jgi:hypothetical protein